MKKLLLTLAAGLFVGGAASAQEVENLVVKVENTWNLNMPIEYTSQWAEFKIVSEVDKAPILRSEYKGARMTYTQASDQDTVQFKYETAAGIQGYPSVDPSATEAKFSFNESIADTDTISYINLQAKTASGKITIDGFWLIKTDDTEVPVEPKEPVWGCAYESDVVVTSLKFKGQYGGAKVLAEDGSALTYDPATESNVVYKYTVELNEPAPLQVLVEVDKAGDSGDTGLKWNNIIKGESSITFEVSAATCSEAVSNIYIKAADSNAALYPAEVSFKSITRTKTIKPVIDETKNKHVIGNGNYVILKSDLEKFADDDVVAFNYNYAWEGEANFDGWGMGYLENPETHKGVSIFGTATPGDYQYLCFIKDLLALCGTHTPAADAAEDDTEWVGVIWNMWNNRTNGVTCTTTKGDIVVYSNVEVDDNALPAIPADVEVVSTEYISLSGVVSKTAQRGVNIVRQALSNGTTRVVKIVEK